MTPEVLGIIMVVSSLLAIGFVIGYALGRAHK